MSYGLVGNEAVATFSAYKYLEGFVRHEAYPVQQFKCEEVMVTTV